MYTSRDHAEAQHLLDMYLGAPPRIMPAPQSKLQELCSEYDALRARLQVLRTQIEAELG